MGKFDKIVDEMFIAYTIIVIIISLLLGFGLGYNVKSPDYSYNWYEDFKICEKQKEDIKQNLSSEIIKLNTKNEQVERFYKYIWEYWRTDAERFDNYADKYIEQRELRMKAEFDFALCMEGVHPLQQ